VIDTTGRHPATQQIARWLEPNPNLPASLQEISARCEHVAVLMLRDLPDGPELTTGLRKLLEAKDCFVRAALDAGEPLPVAGTTDPRGGAA
jgi:hypothetical protein